VDLPNDTDRLGEIGIDNGSIVTVSLLRSKLRVLLWNSIGTYFEV
jgi:hypothetical protein